MPDKLGIAEQYVADTFIKNMEQTRDVHVESVKLIGRILDKETIEMAMAEDMEFKSLIIQTNEAFDEVRNQLVAMTMVWTLLAMTVSMLKAQNNASK